MTTPVQTIPVSRIVNQATQTGHAAVQIGGLAALGAVTQAAAHTDFLQNPTLNKLTFGRAAQLQAPVQAALEGAALVLPGVIDKADAGVTLLGVAGKQYGWAANNVIRAAAVAETDQGAAQAKLELANRQIDRGAADLARLRALVGAPN